MRLKVNSNLNLKTYSNGLRVASLAVLLSIVAWSTITNAQVVVVPLGGDDLVRVWSQRDGDSAGHPYSASGVVEINSLIINVVKDGFLIISGQLFLQSSAGGTLLFQLEAFVDGTLVQPGGGLTSKDVEPTVRDVFNYTVTVPITKGQHTISQEIGSLGNTLDFFTNREYLTVMYIPAGSVENKNSAPLAKSSGNTEQNIDNDGNSL